MAGKLLKEKHLVVLRLIADGASYEEAGVKLFMSISTVKHLLGEIRMILNAKTTIHAVHIAHQIGLFPDMQDERHAIQAGLTILAHQNGFELVRAVKP